MRAFPGNHYFLWKPGKHDVSLTSITADLSKLASFSPVRSCLIDGRDDTENLATVTFRDAAENEKGWGQKYPLLPVSPGLMSNGQMNEVRKVCFVLIAGYQPRLMLATVTCIALISNVGVYFLCPRYPILSYPTLSFLPLFLAITVLVPLLTQCQTGASLPGVLVSVGQPLFYQIPVILNTWWFIGF